MAARVRERDLAAGGPGVLRPAYISMHIISSSHATNGNHNANS
jgi:hypothetical protein